MPLPDVTVKILDGGLGMLPPGTSGLHAKVGVSSAGTVGEIVSVTDPGKIADLFGTGPLANALYDSFAAGARLVYAVRANGDIPGQIGTVTKTKTGQGDLNVTGSPLDAYELVVEIVDPGAKNVATFRYSLDGGDTFSAKITVPTALTYEIPGTGLTLNFSEYVTDPNNSFLAGDRYTCRTTAPRPSVNSVNAAIDTLLNSKYLYEFIHAVGDSDAAMWAALAAKAAEAETRYRYIHFLSEARGPESTETVDQWVSALLAEKSGFASTRVSICAGRFELVDMGTGRIVDRNGAGIYAGRVSSIPVQRSPGEVMEGPLPAVVRLNPPGINDGHILALDEAGFVTFRQYIGLSGLYVTNGRMAAEPTSDFQYVELRRVMDKACAQVRAAALRLEHAEIDPTNMEKSLSAAEAQLTAPLDNMVGAREIARGRVVIPRDQDVLATSKIRVKVRIVPMAIMRWIELEIGFENPFRAAA
ncbi:DUF2586 family protein [Desulfofundulus sp. TPOSR]|uniref:DUF2586 domain-containing protein n=1 Tax=Desulfofundulus sp. TPOSR TaxID=2714340 RepID=UPI0014077EDD|nr:DUF2586 domain-containing protein [Desulfofundulus sp. TPOSR]NHM25461.1 DUF2586 family protein [Desulfofundulus sp. TPOSR]NHM27049.1 DUF2586 family protein [Desulfofundulus sp. TPOSR]